MKFWISILTSICFLIAIGMSEADYSTGIRMGIAGVNMLGGFVGVNLLEVLR